MFETCFPFPEVLDQVNFCFLMKKLNKCITVIFGLIIFILNVVLVASPVSSACIFWEKKKYCDFILINVIKGNSSSNQQELN